MIHIDIVRINFNDYTAEINLSRGANCISLKNGKYNVNILREPDYSKEIDNPFLYGMPILFPVKCGEFHSTNKISRHYKAVKDGRIEVLDKENGLKIIYENDKKFGWRLFYNGNADEFVCLEPQTCMANCQNSEFKRNLSGFDYIKPKSHKKYVSRISVEEFGK